MKSTIPKAWPQCSDCKAAYVLRRAIVFASKPGPRKATMRHEWVWQRDCKHRRAAPEIYPPPPLNDEKSNRDLPKDRATTRRKTIR